MTPFRRMVRALNVALVMCLILAACGDLTPDSLAYATDEADKTVIRIATPRIAGFESVIADWEREHPTATVELVVRSIDDHHVSLLTGAGGPFDLVAFDSTYGPEIREHPEVFLDLETLGEFRSRLFLPSRWAEGVAATGEVIGLPLDVDSTALLVRTDMVSGSIVDDLANAQTWCDVIVAGDAFSDETNTAFLADGDELLTAIFAQTRTSFVSADGEIDPDELDELTRAWDLAMIALGEGPLHGEPCPGVDDVQRISRNLSFDDSMWRAELRSDDFAAVLAPWSDRERVTSAAPETAGNWIVVNLPQQGEGASSEGGLHLGIPADTTNLDLAHDLLRTLTDPVVQRVTFSNGAGPLPATTQLLDGDVVSGATDDFFGTSEIGAIYGSAAIARPRSLATPQRRVVIEAMLDALNGVESGGQTPEEAWNQAVEEIVTQLG